MNNLKSIELSIEFSQALGGDRQAARGMWRRVAIGELGFEEVEWVKNVAKRLLDADSVKEAERYRAITEAVGFKGHLDRYADIREFILSLRDFGFSRKELYDAIQFWGLDDGIVSDLDGVIDRELRGQPRSAP